MSEIMFPEYRDYVADRVEVNNAMIALLAGSRLAAHTLQLTTGSTTTLGELFPAVEHISRFNLPNDEARRLLHDADGHIAAVAIPYALATHEAFVTKMVELIRRECPGSNSLISIKAWNMHSALFTECGHPEPIEWLEILRVLREARNCVIHANSIVRHPLTDAISEMTRNTRTEWQKLNQGQPPEAICGSNGRLALTAEHMFSAFAATKRLGREINHALGQHLGPATWARIAIADFGDTTSRTRNSAQWRRGAIGYVRMHYSRAAVAELDIETAARHLGYWTNTRWN